MCGRFTQTVKAKQVEREFGVKISGEKILAPRYNIAPAQEIAAVRTTGAGKELSSLKWGLVPSWAKDVSIGNKMINARAETLSEKPSFREAFRRRRCIIPASGFYEWQKQSSGAKQPFYFYLKERQVFGFAGLWEEFLDREIGLLLESCMIITTEANEVLKAVHDRMPVILHRDNYDQWLDDKEADVSRLQKLLAPYPSEEMESHPVSRAVNSPASDAESLNQPVNSQ